MRTLKSQIGQCIVLDLSFLKRCIWRIFRKEIDDGNQFYRLELNRCLIPGAFRKGTLRVIHNAGFFSCCSVRLTATLFYFNQYKTLPDRIDSAEQFNSYVSGDRHRYMDLAKIYFRESDDVLKSAIKIQ